jgi:hypothetical protein
MPFSRPCESVAGYSDFMRRSLWVQRTHLNLVRSMHRLLAMLVITGCQAVAQTPGETAHGNLSLQVASPAASPTPALPHQELATPPPDKPHGVSNPKELSEPVKLVAADIIMDGSESVCGKLRGANGKEFWFFLCHGPFAFESNPEEGLYVGYMSGHISWETARARFEGWSEIDFYSLVERTIKDEFTWTVRFIALLQKIRKRSITRHRWRHLGGPQPKDFFAMLKPNSIAITATWTNGPNQAIERTADRRMTSMKEELKIMKQAMRAPVRRPSSYSR